MASSDGFDLYTPLPAGHRLLSVKRHLMSNDTAKLVIIWNRRARTPQTSVPRVFSRIDARRRTKYPCREVFVAKSLIRWRQEPRAVLRNSAVSDEISARTGKVNAAPSEGRRVTRVADTGSSGAGARAVRPGRTNGRAIQSSAALDRARPAPARGFGSVSTFPTDPHGVPIRPADVHRRRSQRRGRRSGTLGKDIPRPRASRNQSSLASGGTGQATGGR